MTHVADILNAKIISVHANLPHLKIHDSFFDKRPNLYCCCMHKHKWGYDHALNKECWNVKRVSLYFDTPAKTKKWSVYIDYTDSGYGYTAAKVRL